MQVQFFKAIDKLNENVNIVFRRYFPQNTYLTIWDYELILYTTMTPLRGQVHLYLEGDLLCYSMMENPPLPENQYVKMRSSITNTIRTKI